MVSHPSFRPCAKPCRKRKCRVCPFSSTGASCMVKEIQRNSGIGSSTWQAGQGRQHVHEIWSQSAGIASFRQTKHLYFAGRVAMMLWQFCDACRRTPWLAGLSTWRLRPKMWVATPGQCSFPGRTCMTTAWRHYWRTMCLSTSPWRWLFMGSGHRIWAALGKSSSPPCAVWSGRNFSPSTQNCMVTCCNVWRTIAQGAITMVQESHYVSILVQYKVTMWFAIHTCCIFYAICDRFHFLLIIWCTCMTTVSRTLWSLLWQPRAYYKMARPLASLLQQWLTRSLMEDITTQEVSKIMPWCSSVKASTVLGSLRLEHEQWNQVWKVLGETFDDSVSTSCKVQSTIKALH